MLQSSAAVSQCQQFNGLKTGLLLWSRQIIIFPIVFDYSFVCLAILRGVGVRGAGCQMLSLILELQTCQLGLCFAHLVTIH